MRKGFIATCKERFALHNIDYRGLESDILNKYLYTRLSFDNPEAAAEAVGIALVWKGRDDEVKVHISTEDEIAVLELYEAYSGEISAENLKDVFERLYGIELPLSIYSTYIDRLPNVSNSKYILSHTLKGFVNSNIEIKKLSCLLQGTKGIVILSGLLEKC